MQLTTVMAAAPVSEAERAAKAALFAALVEALPGLLRLRLRGQGQGLAPVVAALAAVRRLVAGGLSPHQNMFRCALAAMPHGSPFPFYLGGSVIAHVVHGRPC